MTVSQAAPTIEFIFDFASPNAYLSYKVLPEIAARSGAEIKLFPCLLGGIFKLTGNQAPFTAFGHIQGKLDYEQLEMRRFVAKHALSRFTFNPHFPMNTLLIMRAMVAAQHAGVEAQYTSAVLAGMWEDGQKMDDPDVVLAVLNAAGLDGRALLEAAQDPTIKAELASNTDAAATRGVFGVPTYFVGDEMFFGKERLGQVEQCLNERA